MANERKIILWCALLFTTTVRADPAFFEQKEFIRQQNQPFTTPYSEAVKNTNEIQVQEQEAKQAPPAQNDQGAPEEEEPTDDQD